MFKKRKSGLTLLEVVIAVALLTILLLPLIRSFATSARVNRKSRDIMTATDVAQSLMEGIAGKTYQDVVKGMDMTTGGFNFTKAGISSSGAYSFSSINNGFYNAGYGLFMGTTDISTGTKNPTPVDIALTTGNKGVDKSGVDLDKAVGAVAVDMLRTRITNNSGDMYEDLSNVWTGDPTTSTVPADKVLFFGWSSSKHPDGSPKLAYMVYTRIEKDHHFYDAVITFTPAARNVNPNASTGADEYFSYRVRIAMYEYEYDDYGGAGADWPSRFSSEGGSYNFEGEPTAVLETGIQFKN